MRRRAPAATLAVLFALVPLREAGAWGAAGHAIVAEIAQRNLRPSVNRRIKTLLGSEASLASIANWADTLALTRPQTRRWHFVNIPVGAAGYDPDRDCQPTAQGGCIVAAIERVRKTLSDRRASRQARAEALKLLVHLVGDIHQPLHCAERDKDAGGTLLAVTFFGAPSTLHQIWDFGILEKATHDWGEHVRLASEWMAKQAIAPLAQGKPADWAWDSHQLAVEAAYGPLGDTQLGEDYQRRSLPIVHRQLAVAGIRLARMLNEALTRPQRG